MHGKPDAHCIAVRPALRPAAQRDAGAALTRNPSIGILAQSRPREQQQHRPTSALRSSLSRPPSVARRTTARHGYDSAVASGRRSASRLYHHTRRAQRGVAQRCCCCCRCWIGARPCRSGSSAELPPASALSLSLTLSRVKETPLLRWSQMLSVNGTTGRHIELSFSFCNVHSDSCERAASKKGDLDVRLDAGDAACCTSVRAADGRGTTWRRVDLAGAQSDTMQFESPLLLIASRA
ncbi:hypothetical protein L1887_57699 [Cichorium endivia]|nr:hypothetical protein L1887_57699 [Cichorium endivia]